MRYVTHKAFQDAIADIKISLHDNEEIKKLTKELATLKTKVLILESRKTKEK